MVKLCGAIVLVSHKGERTLAAGSAIELYEVMQQYWLLILPAKTQHNIAQYTTPC
jgi:hypothetical protein